MPWSNLIYLRWRDPSRQRFFVSVRCVLAVTTLLVVAFAGCDPMMGDLIEQPAPNAPVAGNQNQPGGAVKWQVAVDPPADLPTVPDGPSLAGLYPLALTSSDDVSFPFTQRPFALVKDRKRARVFDLATGQSLGEVQIVAKESPFREAVSPDGLLWAQTRNQANKVELIRIGSLKTGREMVSIGEGGDADLGRVSFLQFATTDRLVAIARGNTRSQAWVFDADNGRFRGATRKFDIVPQSFSNPHLVEDGAACSPGGKYLAAIVRSHVAADIVFHDLATGTRVGALVMNDVEKGFTPTSVSFSGDGKQFAALGNQGRDHRLHVWDVTNATLVQSASLSEQQFRKDHPNFHPQPNDYPIRWIPNGAGWSAFGRYVIRPVSTSFDPLFPSNYDNRQRLVLTRDVAIGWQYGTNDYALALASPDLNSPQRTVAAAPKQPAVEVAQNNPPPLPAPPMNPRVNPPRDIPKGVEVVVPPVRPEVQPNKPRVNQRNGFVTTEERQAAHLAYLMELDKIVWQPMVDGPLKSLAFIPAPKFPCESARSTLFFPQQRCRFLPARTQGIWQVFDLASGKTLGDLGELKINVYITAVDDVGERFAYLPYEDSGRHEVIAVYNFKTKTTESHSVPQDKGRSIDFLTYDRAGNLIAVADNSYTYTVHSYLPGAKEPQFSVAVPHYLNDGESHAISPGGRFLALVGKDVGSMVDLQTGKIVQQFRTSPDQRGFLPYAVRFSPDGQYLASLGSATDGKFRLHVWSMETGKLVTERSYPYSLLYYSHHSDNRRTPLEWLGNEMLLIHGAKITDRQTGTPFYIIAQDSVHSLKPMTDNSILAVNGSNDLLAVLSLPREKLAAARAVAQKAVSESSPPLRQAAAGPSPALLEDKPAGGMTLAPDAPGVSAQALGSVALKLEPGFESNRFVITDPAVGQAVVEVEHIYDLQYANKNLPLSRAEPLGPERTVRLDFYDVASANKAQSLELPGRARILDVSPDGSLVLTGDSTGTFYSRLDVWAPKLTPQHALGWRAGGVYDARFIDKRHVLVWSEDQDVTLWRLPACEQVYRRKSFRYKLSPTRKYWTDFSGNVIDSLTGKALVRAKLPNKIEADNIGAGTLNFSTRGDSLWCVLSLPRGYEWPAGAHFLRWNLAGELIDHQQVAHTSSPISMLLDDRVLILDGSQANTGALLFNVARKKFIGHTAESPNNYFSASDGTLWGRRGEELRPFTVADLDLDVNADREYKDILLLDEGKSIAIEADTKGITDQAAVEAALRELAAQQKLVVDPAATLKLRFFFQESTLGAIKIQTPTMTLTDSTGQEHWRQTYREFKFEVAFDGAAWIKKHSLPGRLYTKPNPTIFKRPPVGPAAPP